MTRETDKKPLHEQNPDAYVVKKAWPGQVAYEVFIFGESVAVLDFGHERDAHGDALDLAESAAQAMLECVN